MLIEPPQLSIQFFYSCGSCQFDMSHPYFYLGPTCQLEPLFTMKCKNQLALACPIGCFYESHEPPPSGNGRGIVPPHCDGHRNGQQRGYILHCRFGDCCHGGRRGNTERVVTRWQRPVASNVALDFVRRCQYLLDTTCS
jgi:hypothetical protein